MNREEFLLKSVLSIKNEYSFMEDFYADYADIIKDESLSFEENIKDLDDVDLEDYGLSKEDLLDQYYEYFKQMLEFLGISDDRVSSLTILHGRDKNGNEEKNDLTISVGEIIAIVGPTGSGKSRLLADIEWIADRDTPTNRKILINGEEADKKWRFSSGNKLVAQLSQNMNFVMDLTVKEFVELHAQSRMVENIDEVVEKIIDEANRLAGEQFDLNSAVTSLSGGQSRALMIADTAILSKSPIVLIDEIENAGIDRKKALALLIKEEKIVLMATHDPILALTADKRIVIRNGAIDKVIMTTDEERQMLGKLETIDRYLMEKRQEIRGGQILKVESLHVD